MKHRILLISNLYPSKVSPSFGTFVRTNFEQLSEFSDRVDLCIIDKKSTGLFGKIFNYLIFYANQFRLLFFKVDNYDFIYIHYLTISTIPLFILRVIFRRKIKYYINIHGDDLTGTTFKHRLLSLPNGFLVKNALGIVVPSQHFRDILVRKYGDVIQGERICINHSGGINTDLFKLKNIERHDKKVFGYIGRIEEGKGWQDFIEAIQIIKDEKSARFCFYGQGDQCSELAGKINELKAEVDIEYCGEVNFVEVPKVVSSFDYLVFPTYRESLGLVALESAAVGTPVIRTRIDVLDDIFYDFGHLSFEVGESQISQKYC